MILPSYGLIVLVSISTWVTLPGRPLSLGSAGTTPPSWNPVSSCPFYCISSVFSSVFLLGSRLVLFWYNVQCWWRFLQGLDSQNFKGIRSGPRSRSRRLDAQSFQVAQLRQKYYKACTSNLQEQAPVDIVELSAGGQLPPGEVVDADRHSRVST